MNTTIAVVVSAIVILITALVVITIFSGGVNQVGSLTNAQSICRTQAYSSCRSTNSMPITWDIPTVSIPSGNGNTVVACGGSGANDLKLGTGCSSFGGTATSSGTGTTTCTGSCYKDSCGAVGTPSADKVIKSGSCASTPATPYCCG